MHHTVSFLNTSISRKQARFHEFVLKELGLQTVTDLVMDNTWLFADCIVFFLCDKINGISIKSIHKLITIINMMNFFHYLSIYFQCKHFPWLFPSIVRNICCNSYMNITPITCNDSLLWQTIRNPPVYSFILIFETLNRQ